MILILVTFLRRYLEKCWFSSVRDPTEESLSGVRDTTEESLSGVRDTAEKCLSGVSDTALNNEGLSQLLKKQSPKK